MKVSFGISNRHIHVTKEVYDLLFDEEINVDKYLNQKGEFASDKKVTLVANGHEIQGVRILGPFRKYNQVEISHNDALKFKLNPPVRASGDLEGAETITVRTEKGEVEIKGCILAQRHIHMTPEEAKNLGVEDKQKVSIKIDGERSGIIDAYVKVSDNAYFECHLDTDDANAFIIKSGDEGTLII